VRRPLQILLFLSLAACDCGDDGGETPCTSSTECATGELCIDGFCQPRPTSDGGPEPDGATDPDAGPECVSSDDCGTGVCVGGVCCGSADAVCGDECCGGAEVCFANACVTPGATCRTNAECAAGEYCEPGLGEGGPMPDPGECSPSVDVGRCLALPPSCDTAAAGEACVRTDCEYRPEVADLDAVPQWRWDPTTVDEYPSQVDVWSTPVVGRIYDTNCDGAIDELDPSAIVFVSNDTMSGACHGSSVDACNDGVLRALDGATGRELWSLPNIEGSAGFTGVSAALGDLDDDGVMDIVVLTAESRLAAIAGDGTLLGVGTDVLPAPSVRGLGWGGGLAMADMDGDGSPEVAWQGHVSTWTGTGFAEVFDVPGVIGGWDQGTVSTATSFFADLDDDPELELVAGRTAIDTDGSLLWQRGGIADGFAAVADFDGDGAPEVVLVAAGAVHLLEGSSGASEMPPFTLPGNGRGGPPTIADFDGDGVPEIGVAQQNLYSVVEADYGAGAMSLVWSAQNHDQSSSVTGSTVFDFEGDGIAEVIYNDECWMWVYDGPTGNVRFFASTDSFTGTEASLVADVDGDGHAEMVMISTGASPINWTCAEHTTGTDGFPVWTPPEYGPSWRGLSVFRDRANGWVGTRTLWTQHAYHVTNTCDDRDSACDPAGAYGSVPTRERKNWTVPWLNNFRQNVQDEGLFDAPDALVDLRAECVSPIELVATVRNQGPALLPSGVTVGFYTREGGADTLLGTATTAGPLFAGRVEEVRFTAPAELPLTTTFVARILVDPAAPLFRQCDDTNDESAPAMPRCLN